MELESQYKPEDQSFREANGELTMLVNKLNSATDDDFRRVGEFMQGYDGLPAAQKEDVYEKIKYFTDTLAATKGTPEAQRVMRLMRLPKDYFLK